MKNITLKNIKKAFCFLAFVCNDYFCILYQQSPSEYLQFVVNNVLTCKVTKNALSRSKSMRLFYGLHSLDAPPSVDEFNFRIGYSAKPVRQRVASHPKIAPIFNQFTNFVLKLAHEIFPGNPTFAKGEGLIRFYMEGKKPIEKQQWPKALIEQRESILSELLVI
jgi:hypothetical protein